ncbi:MAG: ATP-dependent zinc metalloprotease FtsH [Prevotellaceae bacterium]|jgi:cell division protease FtsH|nr:ATP-dependent zinc metalloprotease FtsH [Prevotellaceae bacterium]
MEIKPSSNKPNGNKPFKPKFNFYWVYLAIGLLFVASFFMPDSSSTKEVSFSKFESILRNNCPQSITVNSAKKTVEADVSPSCAGLTDEAKPQENQTTTVHVTAHIPSVEEFSKHLTDLQKANLYTGEVTYKEGRDYWSVLFTFFPILLIILFFVFASRRMGNAGGGIFNVGKSRAQVFDKNTKEKITFKDVAGLEGAKQEVEEIVSFLKSPDKYTDLGGKIPKGALLVGPPGTGKTLLAKAVAGEADVPFFSLSGSDFVEMFVGVGASRVRDLFRQAKEAAPCIIFIDEIDAIGRARGRNPGMNTNDERENTLNQLLTEMDGFGSNSGVIILAATNRADILDKALLRAGRFDRQIHVDLPDVHERKEIFYVHLRPLKLDDSVDVEFLSRQTPGFSGADIANVCNEAALIAARKNKQAVGKQDFLDAVDRIVGGLEKKTKVMTQEEKRSVAFHEAGHATVSWLLQYSDPLVKVTIVPRGMALGAAWYLPEERQLTTTEHILDEVCALLGGRASENVFFNTASTGALNDLERATKQVYAMVVYFGMSEQLSNISYYDPSGNEFAFAKPYSEATAELIDKEVKELVNVQFERAKQILIEHEDSVRQIADILIEREVLFSDDVKAILGERPWKSRGEELLGETPQKETQDSQDTPPEFPVTEETSSVED